MDWSHVLAALTPIVISWLPELGKLAKQWFLLWLDAKYPATPAKGPNVQK